MFVKTDCYGGGRTVLSFKRHAWLQFLLFLISVIVVGFSTFILWLGCFKA